MAQDESDPLNSIFLAIQSLRLLGIISYVFAGLMLLVILFVIISMSISHSSGGGPIPIAMILNECQFYTVIFGTFMAAGIVLRHSAKQLRKGSRGWAITAIVFSIVFIVVSVPGLIISLLLLLYAGPGIFTLIPVIVVTFFIAAFVHLIYRLKLTMDALHLMTGYRGDRFEVQVRRKDL